MVRPTMRNNRKECISVLKGLCAGGHVAMAQELVGSVDRPWRGGLLKWPANDPDLLDDMRSATDSSSHCSLLWSACEGGHLEAVKWVMSRFGVGREVWEVVAPFQAALRKGNVKVVKWLACSTGVVGSGQAVFTTPHHCHPGDFLEVVKLCMGWFPEQKRGTFEEGNMILHRFIHCCCSQNAPHMLLEGCQWLKETLSITQMRSLEYITNKTAFQWAIETFSVSPTQQILCGICRNGAEKELVQWYLQTFAPSIGPIAPETFIEACGKTTVSVLKLLLPTTPPLTVDNLQQALENSLNENSIITAAWLDETFHVMESFNGTPTKVNSVFINLCSPSGVKWFLSKVSPHNISEKAVRNAVHRSVDSLHFAVTLFLLRTFNVSVTFHQKAAIRSVIEWGTIQQAKQIISHVVFSSPEMATCLSLCECMQSSKTVRWLIRHFHLNEEQTKMNDNHLLLLLLRNNKKKCAEWLIHKFHITFDQVCYTSRHNFH
ncbi:hypothetical protein Pelo_5811 [Pelomyxa schiedti]|nr:hypothetical protein Pelo_5811 [Pelomyxa schiedti]